MSGVEKHGSSRGTVRNRLEPWAGCTASRGGSWRYWGSGPSEVCLGLLHPLLGPDPLGLISEPFGLIIQCFHTGLRQLRLQRRDPLLRGSARLGGFCGLGGGDLSYQHQIFNSVPTLDGALWAESSVPLLDAHPQKSIA
jgi:hypothetical protein